MKRPSDEKTLSDLETGLMSWLEQYTLSDDGKGIDYNKILEVSVGKKIITVDEAGSLSEDEAIQLIFKPGFSTKNQTSAISGRGVGMDDVLKNLNSIRGTIKIKTEIGKGTEFIISFPIMK